MTNSHDVLVWQESSGIAPDRDEVSVDQDLLEQDLLERHPANPANNGELTDDELVRVVCGGDETAFTVLFERHKRMVTRYAYRFFYRREQVEDIVQQSFVKAYFSLPRYNGGHERSFVAWLSRITIYTCYDELRRPHQRSESLLSDLAEDDVSFLSNLVRETGAGGDIEKAAISRDLAEKLLKQLRPADRMVLTLLDIAGLSIAEIAGLLGWTEPKVKTRAYRARNVLREALHRFQ